MEFITLPSNILQSGIFSLLEDTTLLALTGADAATFLHSQLTNDVTHLPAQSWRLGGYCTPKGRLLATLRYWRDSETVYLQLPKSVAESTRKRLQMFIMRAKAVFSSMDDNLVMAGLYGNAITTALQAHFSALPAPGQLLQNEHGTLIRLADISNEPACIWVMPRPRLAELQATLAAHLTAVSNEQWHAIDIASGIAVIELPTQEKFVPQMINYELVGGVSFKKGCYPGQEIVARSQYLGTVKRRAILTQADLSSLATGDAAALVAAGTELFTADDPDQPCGTIINSAPLASAGRWLCLVEVKLKALEGAGVCLGKPDGPRLQQLDLPYSITDSATD